jgi:putative two-component system response regulator
VASEIYAGIAKAIAADAWNGGAAVAAYFQDALKCIRQMPRDDALQARVDCLLAGVGFLYVTGYTALGVEWAQEAVASARALGSRQHLRRALSNSGVLNADAANFPAAIEAYSEALEVAIELKDAKAEATVWLNLGPALMYAAQYAESIECSERALAIALREGYGLPIITAAPGNIALASLHLEDLSKGLRMAKRSVEASGEPRNDVEKLNRVLHESTYTRLLIEVDSLVKAKERCELAKRYAQESNSQPAQLAATLAEGLYEIHAGLKDVGLSRLENALERARGIKSFLRDTLVAMVKGYEAAGEPEKALSYLRELMLHTRQAQQENVLYHHRLHLERLEDEGAGADGAFKKLKKHQDALQGKVAERKLLQAQLDQLERLAVTAELRDDSTGEHSYRVGKLASLLAKEYGCDEHTCFMVDLAARLHDIGKIGIPDGILLKPDRLSKAERDIMQTHTTVGAELLAKSNIPHMQMAEEIARAHHEWWDGTGYPHGIIGRGIPIGARIAALADVFDALTHKRPYKEPWPVFKALEEIKRLRGLQFDPELTDLFIPLVQRLQREVGDLDEYLGLEARQSPFIQARQKISETLRRQTDPRFDAQR